MDQSFPYSKDFEMIEQITQDISNELGVLGIGDIQLTEGSFNININHTHKHSINTPGIITKIINMMKKLITIVISIFQSAEQRFSNLNQTLKKKLNLYSDLYQRRRQASFHNSKTKKYLTVFSATEDNGSMTRITNVIGDYCAAEHDLINCIAMYIRQIQDAYVNIYKEDVERIVAVFGIRIKEMGFLLNDMTPKTVNQNVSFYEYGLLVYDNNKIFSSKFTGMGKTLKSAKDGLVFLESEAKKHIQNYNIILQLTNILNTGLKEASVYLKKIMDILHKHTQYIISNINDKLFK